MPWLSGRLRNPSAKRLTFKLVVFFTVAGRATGDGRDTGIGLASTMTLAVAADCLSRFLVGLGNASFSRRCSQLHLCPIMTQSLSLDMW